MSPSITFPVVEKELLTDVYRIAHSPLVSGAALDSLLAFFSALVQADSQIATHVVPNLVIGVEKSPKAEANPSNVAKCIGQVVRSSQGVAAGTIAEYSKAVKVRFFYFVSFATIRTLEQIEIVESQVIDCRSESVDLGRARSLYVSIYFIWGGAASYCSAICLSNTTCSTMLSTTSLQRKKRSGLRLHLRLVSATLS